MSETSANVIEYRGYTLTAVKVRTWLAGADISRPWSTFANTAWSHLGSYKGGGVCESAGNCRSPPFGLKPGLSGQSLETAEPAIRLHYFGRFFPGTGFRR